MSNEIRQSHEPSPGPALQRFHDGPCCRRCVEKKIWPWVDAHHAACCCASAYVGRHDEVVCAMCGFLREILGESEQVRLHRVRAHATNHRYNAEWDFRGTENRTGNAIAAAIMEQDKNREQQAVEERSRKQKGGSSEQRRLGKQHHELQSPARTRRVEKIYVGSDGFLGFKYEGEQ